MPWCRLLRLLGDEPRLRSRAARHWFAHLEAVWRDGGEASVVVQAVSGYAVAGAKSDLGHAHEAWWWMQLAATQTEFEDPATLGLVAVVRAERLLGLTFPSRGGPP